MSACLGARGAPPPRAAARLASLARRGRRRCRLSYWLLSSMIAAPPTVLLASLQQELVHHHNDDDDQSYNQTIIKRSAGDLRQRVAQHAENERPEHGSDHRSAAARQAGAADDGRCNDIEFVAGREIGLTLTLDNDEHDAGDCREQTAEQIDRRLQLADRDP